MVNLKFKSETKSMKILRQHLDESWTRVDQIKYLPYDKYNRSLFHQIDWLALVSCNNSLSLCRQLNFSDEFVAELNDEYRPCNVDVPAVQDCRDAWLHKELLAVWDLEHRPN